MSPREKREAELYALMRTNYEALIALYMNKFGKMPQVGATAGYMIDEILDKEFPQQP